MAGDALRSARGRAAVRAAALAAAIGTALAAGAGAAPRGLPVAPPADTARCAAAAAFVRSEPRTVAVVERDTIDDWRTGHRLAGCRVTAAGITRLGLAGEAVRFFERLRAAGWTRTPEPRDSPNEASLRFRHGDVDCVFSVYGEARLGTDAEFTVTDAVTARAGEARYMMLVLCMPALPARLPAPGEPR